MIDKILDCMLNLAFTSVCIAASVAVWMLVWMLFEGTKAGAIFIQWLKERKEE